MPRVLIAGLGSIGRRHLRNLTRLGVSDITLLRSHDVSLDEMPHLPVVTTIDEGLAMNPDLVLVCTPTSQHFDVAIPAARAGRDLFIEKPLSDSWDRIGDLADEIRAHGIYASVGFDLRFDPGLERVKQLIDGGVIGKVVAIQAQVGQYLPDWRPDQDYRTSVTARREAGGGVILELSHELDYVSWLVGPVAQVSCVAGKISDLDIETEDTAAIVLRFMDGAIGTVHLDCVQRIPSRTCRVIGTNGTITWDYHSSEVQWFDAARGVWDRFEYAGFTRDDRFVAEMRHLLACTQRLATPKVNIVSAARTLAVVLAAKQAAATERVTRVSEWPLPHL